MFKKHLNDLRYSSLFCHLTSKCFKKLPLEVIEGGNACFGNLLEKFQFLARQHTKRAFGVIVFSFEQLSVVKLIV